MNENNVEEIEVDLSRSEVNAERILRRIHVHDYESGGIYSEVTGAQGSGKTSVLLSFLDYTLKHYKKEKAFWNECFLSPLQFLKIGAGRYTIMVEKDAGVTFHDRARKGAQISPDVIMFDGFQDLWDKSIPGKCNAVFFKQRPMLMDFVGFLRGAGEFVHVFVDEMSEVCPAFSAGKSWKKTRDFSFILKDVRKTMINLHSNTQSVQDVDHRCRSKIMLKIYLPGSRADKFSRLTQRALDNLHEDTISGNEGYLELSGKFGKCSFSDIYKPDVNKHWEARVK